MPSSIPAAGRRTHLTLDQLDDRTTPAFLTTAEIVVGADIGATPIVRIVDPQFGIQQHIVAPFDLGFTGGVRVAVGDVTGDGYPDLVCAAGPGGGPEVVVYDGKTGALSAFYAFDPSFTGGVAIAVGDVAGDGKAEIVAGAGAGGGPEVAVFDGSGDALRAFYAYQPDFHGGVNVAVGDVTGGGNSIITVPGPGGGPNVRVFDQAGGLRNSFFAYDPSFRGGASVAAADLDSDGRAEIVTGAGPGGGPAVGVFRADGFEVDAFYAYGSDFLGGVRVATAALTDDGASQILTAAGPGGASQVNVYQGGTPVSSFFAFPPTSATGFFPAGSPATLIGPPPPVLLFQPVSAAPVDDTPNAPTGSTVEPVSDPFGDTSQDFGFDPGNLILSPIQ